jgi:hypothetical protein
MMKSATSSSGKPCDFFDESFVHRDQLAVDLGDRPAKMLFDSVIQPI